MTRRSRGLRLTELVQPLQPIDAVSALEDPERFVLLDAVAKEHPRGRYAFLCGDPFLVFKCRRQQALVGPPGEEAEVEGDPLDVLANLLQAHRPDGSAWHDGLPPLLSGAVGYLGYELLYLIEDTVPDTGRDDVAAPDADLLFCGTIVAHDAVAQRSWLITTAFAPTATEADATAYARHQQTLAKLQGLAPHPHSPRQTAPRARRRLALEDLQKAGFSPVQSRAEYLNVVAAAREHIFAGDVFELCTTQRFDTRWSGDGRALYEALRTVNPAPFAAWLKLPEVEVLSASPEQFLSLDRTGRAQTRPIKGTRPRGATPEEDERLREELRTSEKDRAENVMIVDLARNDLGRVCRFGTVKVPQLMEVESFAFTHQLVSTVTGVLREGLGPVDLLRAAFPGGSMTGAPKVEAMRLIDSLEPVKRGVFSGSIGYFDFEGALDLSIVIRTFVRRGDLLTFHVGGAIVSDSVPEDEYQETLDKAHGLVAAFERVRGG